MLTWLLLSVVSLFWLNFASIGYLPKFTSLSASSSDRLDPDHLVTAILKGIKHREFDKLRDAQLLNLWCYECLVIRRTHAVHCQECGRCVSS